MSDVLTISAYVLGYSIIAGFVLYCLKRWVFNESSELEDIDVAFALFWPLLLAALCVVGPFACSAMVVERLLKRHKDAK